jgi:hypothetical protein
VFDILNKWGNILYDKFKLELDVNFLHKNKRLYKFDREGIFEYQDDWFSRAYFSLARAMLTLFL